MLRQRGDSPERIASRQVAPLAQRGAGVAEASDTDLHPDVAPELVAAAQAETARVVELFEAQRRVHLTSRPPDEAVRRDRLDRLAAALGEHADTIVGAISADFGNRPLAGALAGEVLLQLEEIRTTKRSLRRWMAPFRPQPRYLRFAGIKAWVEPTPLGVVGVISPWNFPVALAIQPTIAAIAAGNTVMIKMSDLAPRAGAAVAEAVAQRFDAEELAVVCGGLEVATAFSALPFDHLFFTGSAAVAKHVQRAAADNLTPLTLELGGKNPTVVATDADLRTAARRIVAARLANSGQVCLSPDYVFVPNPSLAEFVDAAMDAGHRALPTVLDNPDYCTIVNDSHYERICALVQDAHDRGATVREVVPAGESLPSRQARRIPFTLISDVSAGMAVLDEEIFGPVLPVLGYDDVSEVIDFVNARPTPLAAYWFGPDSADFRHFTARTRSGGVTRNDFALHASLQGLPFGGVGSSGTGYYHGKYGFDTFSHMRAFAVSPKHFSPVSLLSPPFDHRLERGLGFVISAWSRRFTKRVNPRRPSQASPEVGP